MRTPLPALVLAWILRAMQFMNWRFLRITLLSAVLSGCGAPAHLPVSAGVGPAPELPSPPRKIAPIPLINVVNARRWRGDDAPHAAEGLRVAAFARGLDHPRWLYVLPNGDVLVAETNAPRRPDDARGIRGFFFKYFQARAGGGVPSANEIILLRDTNGDGVARRSNGISLQSAFAVRNDTGWKLSIRRQHGSGRALSLYARRTADHRPRRQSHSTPWWAAQSPLDQESHRQRGRSSLVRGSRIQQQRSRERSRERELESRDLGDRSIVRPAPRVRVRAEKSGRHGVGAGAWHALGAVNERDELGSDLVPDYMTAVREGGFYGWPYSYYGGHVDARVRPQRPDLVARPLSPTTLLGPHTASLGLAWSGATALPPASSEECSLASTDRGIARRAAATK